MSVPKTWTLFLCKYFPLFQSIHMAASYVSENDLYNWQRCKVKVNKFPKPFITNGGGWAGKIYHQSQNKTFDPLSLKWKKKLMNPPSFIWKSTYPLPKSVFIFNSNNIVYTVKQSTNACEVHSSVSSFCSAFLSLPRVSLPHPLISPSYSLIFGERMWQRWTRRSAATSYCPRRDFAQRRNPEEAP